MSQIFTKPFWTAAGERAIKTFAQALVAILGSNAVGLLDANWVAALSAAGMAALLSVLTSVGSSGKAGSPSLAGETLDTRNPFPRP